MSTFRWALAILYVNIENKLIIKQTKKNSACLIKVPDLNINKYE